MTTRSKCAKTVVALAHQGVAMRDGIHYSQRLALRWVGIDQNMSGPKQQPPYADCSAYTTWLMWKARKRHRGGAGADIVNGQSWTAGYTGTQIQHGRRHRFGVSLYKPGRTLVFYANSGSTPEHVAVYVGDGKVVSHGSEAGPLLLPYNYRRIVQARVYPL